MADFAHFLAILSVTDIHEYLWDCYRKVHHCQLALSRAVWKPSAYQPLIPWRVRRQWCVLLDVECLHRHCSLTWLSFWFFVLMMYFSSSCCKYLYLWNFISTSWFWWNLFQWSCLLSVPWWMSAWQVRYFLDLACCWYSCLVLVACCLSLLNCLSHLSTKCWINSWNV